VKYIISPPQHKVNRYIQNLECITLRTQTASSLGKVTLRNFCSGWIL